VLRNNHEETIAAYYLTPVGGEELRAQQMGYHAIRSALKLPLCCPRRMMLSDSPFETTIIQLVDAISSAPHTDRRRIFSDQEQKEHAGDDLLVRVNLHSRLGDTNDAEGGDGIGEGNSDDGELTEELIADDALLEERMMWDLTEFAIPQSSSFPVNYRKAMQQMQWLLLGIRLDLSVYHEIYYTWEHFFLEYDAGIAPINHSSDYLIQLFQQQWLFGDPYRLPFRWGLMPIPIRFGVRCIRPRNGGRLQSAIRLISVRTSEAGCGRSLSMQ
jgi:hypothetical protein